MEQNSISLCVGDAIHEVEPLAREFAQREQIGIGKSGFGISAETDELGDYERVFRVVLCLSYVQPAQSVRLNGIDHMHDNVEVHEFGIQIEPVMPRRFHAEFKLR